MSFILIPKDGEDLQVNGWNWRPTIALLLQANLINEQQHELLGINTCGASVDSQTATRIAEFMDRQLKKMSPGQRLRGDLTIASEPKKPVIFTPTSKVEDYNPVEEYSASYEWLVMFRDFCRTSQGFRIS